MAQQPSLFEIQPADVTPIIEVDGPATGTWAERAAAFHANNPHVYALLVRLARYAQSKGLRRWGIKAAFEVLRFKAIETVGDLYKLNNNYTAWYAREIMRREPDLSEFFATRTSPHDPDFYQQ